MMRSIPVPIQAGLVLGIPSVHKADGDTRQLGKQATLFPTAPRIESDRFDGSPQCHPRQDQQSFSQHFAGRPTNRLDPATEQQCGSQRCYSRGQRNTADASSISVASLRLLQRQSKMGVDGGRDIRQPTFKPLRSVDCDGQRLMCAVLSSTLEQIGLGISVKCLGVKWGRVFTRYVASEVKIRSLSKDGVGPLRSSRSAANADRRGSPVPGRRPGPTPGGVVRANRSRRSAARRRSTRPR